MRSIAQRPEVYGGVNLVGDLYTKIGLSEAARKLTVALLKAGVNVSYCERLHSYGIERFRPESHPEFQNLPKGYLHPINLLTHAITLVAEMNPNEFESYKQGKYTIPYWFWEFQEFPQSYARLFERVDEIWVASGYLKTAIEKYTQTPVRVVPVPVDFDIPASPNRKRFGIPEDKFVFLFSFSALSSVARKNPFAVARAFEIAFADVKYNRPLLIMKSTYLSDFPNAAKDLQNLVRRVGGQLIDENYSRETMNELLACADAYVSLHRSEGFGLGMAEAMYLGKAVIATNYSSNTDFMTADNSYLVDYQLRSITHEDHFYQPTFEKIYEPGYMWAEPDIEHAAHLLRQAYDDVEERRVKSKKAAEDIRNYYSYEAVGEIAKHHLSSAEQILVRTQGINIIGDLHAEVGISEAARRLVDAILSRNIEISYLEQVHNEWVQRSSTEEKEKYALLKSGNIHAINLVVRNIGEMPALTKEALDQLTAGKYTIAYWFWETEQLPENFIPQVDRVDEIWVASQHVQKAFRSVNASIPVHVMPVPIEVTLENRFDRKHFGLPEDSFIFFFNFSATSGIGRKNPWAVIDAFRNAFTHASPGGPLLVFKVSGLDVYPQFKAELKARMDQIGGLVLGDTLSRSEMNALLACIDVYVSLHRAEGFGLGLAEAMYLGKPTIGTGYSSNIDFMNNENSYLVDFTLRPIKDTDHFYDPAMKHFFKPGMMSWAEPDVNQASLYMQQLYSEPQSGLEKGKKAAETIHSHFSKEAVGNRILVRLQQLLAVPKTQIDHDRVDSFVSTAEIEHTLPLLHQKFHVWNTTRLQSGGKLAVIRRIPVIGHAVRLLTQALRIGSVWSLQAEFDNATLIALSALSKYLRHHSTLSSMINTGKVQDSRISSPTGESAPSEASLREALSANQAELITAEASLTRLRQTLDKAGEKEQSSQMIESIEIAVNEATNEIAKLSNKATNQE